MEKTCLWCGKRLRGKQVRYCSKGCRDSAAVKAWRHRTKRKAVEYLGGRCVICGYDKCMAAMTFHHPDQNKRFGISDSKVHNWEKIKKELDKCDLLCLNCHAEHHRS